MARQLVVVGWSCRRRRACRGYERMWSRVVGRSAWEALAPGRSRSRSCRARRPRLRAASHRSPAWPRPSGGARVPAPGAHVIVGSGGPFQCGVGRWVLLEQSEDDLGRAGASAGQRDSQIRRPGVCATGLMTTPGGPGGARAAAGSRSRRRPRRAPRRVRSNRESKSAAKTMTATRSQGRRRARRSERRGNDRADGAGSCGGTGTTSHSPHTRPPASTRLCPPGARRPLGATELSSTPPARVVDNALVVAHPR